MKNDPLDLVLKDAYGMPCQDSELFFKEIVIEMIDEVEKTDEKRILEAYRKY